MVQDATSSSTSVSMIEEGLAPYIKTRQEVLSIRRALALHLRSRMKPSRNEEDDHRFLFLPDITANVNETIIYSSGVRKDYLRSVQSSSRIHEDSDQIRQSALQLDSELGTSLQKVSQVGTKSLPQDQELSSTFANMATARRRLDRLRSLHESLVLLSTAKQAATIDKFNSANFKMNRERLPSLPIDVISDHSARRSQANSIVQDVSHNLDRAVLKSKLFVRHERKLLRQLSTSSREFSSSRGTTTGKSVVEALSRTRDSLISWIEGELARAASQPGNDIAIDANTSTSRSQLSVDTLLKDTKVKYERYGRLRQDLMQTLASDRSSLPEDFGSSIDIRSTEAEPAEDTFILPSTPLDFDEILCVCNEQKALVQWKSFQTTTLAKQQKRLDQSFNRLASESHLLPLYPLPAEDNSRRIRNISYLSEVLVEQRMSMLRHAKSWVYATDLANITTKEALLESIEKGQAALEGARRTCWEFWHEVGIASEGFIDEDETGDSNRNGPTGNDIWNNLDGQIGAIRLEEH